MPRSRSIASCDCETAPFKHGRPDVGPFIWGYYDGFRFETFTDTQSFVNRIWDLNIILYAHNGGKFDFMFLLKYCKGETQVQIINGRIISMYLGRCELRDSYAIIPEALKKFGAKKELDYDKLEPHRRGNHADEIREYLYYDCKILYDACYAYRNQAGKYKTIASNALAFSRRLGIDPGKTNARFDEQFRPFYYGGRTECFKPGTHKDISLIDIHSAYPFAMTHDHATGSDFFLSDTLDGLSREQIQRSFISLDCYSAGAFPKRTGGLAGLAFPHEYGRFDVTGWEYVAAKELGLIKQETIHIVRYTNDTINFGAYVQYWYNYKTKHPKDKFPVEYIIGKIMMNSLYGKLAQNPARYYDYKIVDAGTPIDIDNGWMLQTAYGEHEIHARESLWKWKHKNGIDTGEDWKAKPLYKNVATGASVTGFTRAHLLRAIHTLGIEYVIYCDTDGIACLPGARLDGLSMTDALGDWGVDDAGAPLGHFAGKKLYGIKLSEIDEKTGKNKEKIASKGAKLKFNDLEKIIGGETIEWKNDAPTFKLDGTFSYLVREIRQTANGSTIKPRKQKKWQSPKPNQLRL